MSRLISMLLNKDYTNFKDTIERLEIASGEHGVDVELTSEIIIQAKRKTRELGLDPDDTTAPELYRALLNLVALHDSFLRRTMRFDDETDIDELLHRISMLCQRIIKNKKVWVLKQSAAKRLLIESKPDELVKQLGYRSLESMVKREPIEDLFAGLLMSESSSWLEKFYEMYHKLEPVDFESRQIKVKYLGEQKWSILASKFYNKHKHNIIELNELGNVIILPLNFEDTKGVSIVTLPLVLHTLNRVRAFSSYFKLNEVQPNFGQKLGEAIKKDAEDHLEISSEKIPWKIFHNFISYKKPDIDLEIFGPQLQAEDFTESPIEEYLYKIEPALYFWHGINYIGLSSEDGIVSFNLLDVAINYMNNYELVDSSREYLGESLWQELMHRYLTLDPIKDQVVPQIDGIEPIEVVI